MSSIKIQAERISMLKFADNIVIHTDNSEYRSRLNCKNNMRIIRNENNETLNIKTGYQKVVEVKEFSNSGSKRTHNGYSKDIKSISAQAKRVLIAKRNLLPMKLWS